LASSDKPLDLEPRGVTPAGVTRGHTFSRRAVNSLGAWRSDGAARWVFIWPSVVVILCLSIFPLVASLTLAFSKLVFLKGQVDIDWVGFNNFSILLFGTERTHLLGLLRPPTPLGWIVFGIALALVVRTLARSLRAGQVRPVGVIARIVSAVLVVGLVWLVVQTLFSEGGRPGSLVVTIVYVVAGIGVQYVLGLGLAILAVQPLRNGRQRTGAEPSDPVTGDELGEVAPVRPDVGEGARHAAELCLDAPVVVLGGQQPILEIRPVHELHRSARA